MFSRDAPLCIYNTYITPAIFKDNDIDTNVKIIAALFANTYRETNGYLSCKELLKSVGTEVCSPSDHSCPSYYQNNIPHTDNTCCGPGSYLQKYDSDYGGRGHLLCCDWSTKSSGCDTPNKVADYNKCWKGKDIQCKDSWNGNLSNEYCFFGRGAIQITYISNYNNINKVLQQIPLKSIDSSAKDKDRLDLLANPDEICNNGIIAWLSALAYFIQLGRSPVTAKCEQWLYGKSTFTGQTLASDCIGGDGAGDSTEREKLYENYLNQLGI